VLRDAVAEAGTGPALLCIQDWIVSKKLKSEEAAQVVNQMSESARVPNEDYMQAFYNLLSKKEVESQSFLYDSATLAFTNLVRKVYFNSQERHNQYPVHIVGKLASSKFRAWVIGKYIHSLTQKLHEAFNKGSSHKIQVYIRALGNVAHPKILAAFEPYLEGKRSATLFQRLQMVIALDHLAITYPKNARSVLYKIYQNYGDAQEIRVAAVYQLMRSQPSVDILQRMAEDTNIDPHEGVNSAIKSAIQSAAYMQEHQYSQL
jgi:Lipoprotein amino terminal region